LRGLDDTDFEVRFRSAIALSAIVENADSSFVTTDLAFEKAQQALDEHDRVWDEVIHVEDDDIRVTILDAEARKHYNKGLQHVFEILGLGLSRDVLRRALGALWSEDASQRGTALEYLSEVLPEELRAQLWPKLKVADQLSPPLDPPTRPSDAPTRQSLTGGN
jgi:hypothetical protein